MTFSGRRTLPHNAARLASCLARDIHAAESYATGSRPLAAAQAELDHIGPLGAEAGLAVAEVEPPKPAEALVEAEAFDLIPRRIEAVAPFGERVGVVLAEANDIAPLEPRALGLLFQATLRWQHAAGKHVFLDEVGAPAVVGEQLVADGDDLQSGAAAGRQRLVDLSEVPRPIGLADSFEHLDRGHPIEAALDIAVVDQPDLGPLGQALLEQPPLGELVLGGRDGDGGDLCADLPGGELGETAPSAPDFEHVVVWPELDLACEARILVALRFAERLPGTLEPGRRVGHRGIEPAGI